MSPSEGEQAVDAYLAALPDPRRAALQRVREIVHRIAPEAVDRFSYRIPIIRLQQDLVGYSAAARHLSLHVMSTTIVADVMARHPDLRGGGATLRFTEDSPLPEDLIEEIVEARLQENAAWRMERGR